MDEAKYAAGDLIASKYRLVEILGEGGMGSVWRGRNLTLEVDVAIKLIGRELAGDEAWEHLLEEARTTARLGHPGIVRVFDFGETERGDPFIVMEHLTGPLLADVLEQRTRLPPMEAVRLLLPIAGALAAVHAKGIVHCDIKPENVVLAANESGVPIPKLIDFGIAKLHFGEHASARGAGVLVGTPGYMSPEQAAGRADLDPRSDVWSFCVMFYESLTGERPWGVKAGEELLEAVRGGGPAPPAAFGVDDEGLWGIVARGLRDDPVARWGSMRELGQELAAWAFEHGADADATGTSLMMEWFEDKPPSLVTPPDVEPLSTSQPSSEEGQPSSEEGPEEGVAPPSGEGVGDSAPGGQLDSQVSVVPMPAPTEPSKAARWRIAGTAVLAAGAATLGFFVVRSRVAPDVPTSPPTPAIAGGAARPSSQERLAPVRPPALASTDATDRERPSELAEGPAAKGAREADASVCVARLLPEGSLGGSATREWLCSERDPRRGAGALRSELVRVGAGRVTEGMREWAMLGWYEMAAFAVAQASCCATAVEVALPPPLGSCAPLAKALEELAEVVRAGGDPEAAVGRYTTAVHCAVASGAGPAYPYGGAPRGGEETAFRRVLSRATGRELPPASLPHGGSKRASGSATGTPTYDE